MDLPGLSFNTRKALKVHLGDEAGNEVADILHQLAQHVHQLQQNKVDVMRLVPEDSCEQSPLPRRAA